jgi:predicted dehydrogenase
MNNWNKPGDWWRSSKTMSGGILYDWGVHLLEYTLQIIDADIVEVTGFAKKGFWAPHTPYKNDTIEDEGFAVVRFSNGAWSSLSISTVDSKPKAGMLEITGTKGTMVVNYGNYEIYTHEKNGVSVLKKGQSPKPEYWRYYKNIADHLVKGEKLIITPEWSRRPIHILDLADRSAKLGRTLKAKYK